MRKESNACPQCGFLTDKGIRREIISNSRCKCDGRLFRKNERFCYHCASEISLPSSCSNCGIDISKEWNRCIECGVVLKTQENGGLSYQSSNISTPTNRLAKSDTIPKSEETVSHSGTQNTFERLKKDWDEKWLNRHSNTLKSQGSISNPQLNKNTVISQNLANAGEEQRQNEKAEEMQRQKEKAEEIQRQKEKADNEQRKKYAFMLDNKVELNSTIKDSMEKGLDLELIKFAFNSNRINQLIIGLLTTLKAMINKNQVPDSSYLDDDILLPGSDSETMRFHSIRTSLVRCHESSSSGKMNLLYHLNQSTFSDSIKHKDYSYKNFLFSYFPDLMVQNGIAEEWKKWYSDNLFPEASGGEVLFFPDCGECGDAEDVTYHDSDLDSYWCGSCGHEISVDGVPQCQYSDEICETCDKCDTCGDASGVDEDGWCHDCDCSAWDEDDEDDIDLIRSKKLESWDRKIDRFSNLQQYSKFSLFTLSEIIMQFSSDDFFTELEGRFLLESQWIEFETTDGIQQWEGEMTRFVYDALPSSDDEDYDLAEELSGGFGESYGDPWSEMIFETLLQFFINEPSDSTNKSKFKSIMEKDECIVCDIFTGYLNR